MYRSPKGVFIVLCLAVLLLGSVPAAAEPPTGMPVWHQILNWIHVTLSAAIDGGLPTLSGSEADRGADPDPNGLVWEIDYQETAGDQGAAADPDGLLSPSGAGSLGLPTD